MEILEYLVSLRGAKAAAAEVQALSGEFSKLGAAQARAAGAGAGGAGMGASMGLLAKTAKVGALALAGVGFEATKMAVNFNHEMLRIRTDAGASTSELAHMKTGVLELAASGKSMGAGPMSLAQGLYHLESLGIRGKPALKALALAAQEASISGANLEQTTTAMGAAMYVGIKGTGSLTHLMGTLNAVVGAGNMRFQDLNMALGTGVLASAKVAGLSLQDVGAALAVATDAGYHASSAAAQLGTAFHFLYAPTSKAVTALKSIGLDSTTLASDMHKPQGLLVALTDLKTHLAGLSDVQKAQVLNSIIPGGRGRILLTEMTMLDRLKGKYAQINSTAGGFQGSVNQQQKDPGTQVKVAEAALQASMIRLGNTLLPIVVPALTAIANLATKLVSILRDKVVPAIKDVVKWFTNLHGPAAAIVKVVALMAAQYLLIAGLKKVWDMVKLAVLAVRGAFMLLAANPLLVAIAAFVAVAVLIVTHWKEVKRWIDNNKTAVIALVTVLAPIAGMFAAAFVVGKVQAMVGAIAGVLRAIGLIGPASATAAAATATTATAVEGSFAAMALAGVAAAARIAISFAGIISGAVAAQAAVGAVTGQVATGPPGSPGPNNPSGSLSNPNIGSGGGGSGQGGINLGGLHIGLPFGLAEGGIVNRRTLAIIGEAGPEAVVPLSKLPGASPLATVPAPSQGGGWNHGDIVVKIGHNEFVRVLGATMREQMARGA